MHKSSDFVDQSHPNCIYWLKKAIYGLKQGSHVKYQALNFFVISFGFNPIQSKSLLFRYRYDGIIIYFLVYVDDLTLIESHIKFLQKFFGARAGKFSLKDVGDLHYVLEIWVIVTKCGLFLKQHNYIRDILTRATMLGAKEIATLMAIGSSLTLVSL